MKNIISSLSKKFGITINKYPSSGFEYLLNKKRYENQTINLLGSSFDIADSLSFYYSHREIFIDEIYKFQTETKTPNIIDCGSNYGTSLVFFKNLYPNAKIIGIEADPNIFNMLRKNINHRNYQDISLINKAVSNKKGLVKFFSEGADGGRIHKMDESKKLFEVETITLDDIIHEYIDFIKMDIEGSETDAICSIKKIDYVDKIFIEYHSFVDQKQNLDKLLNFLRNNEFRYFIQTQFCSKKPFIDTDVQLGMDLQLNIFAKRT